MIRTAIQHKKKIGKQGGPPNEKTCKDSLHSIGSLQGYPPKMIKEVVRRVLDSPLEHTEKHKDRAKSITTSLSTFSEPFH